MSNEELVRRIAAVIKDEFALYGNHVWIDAVARKILAALALDTEKVE